MRRFLRVLCAATLGASAFGALPAAAAEPTFLVVWSGDPLLNENGDGYWESATVSVSTDADEAHWSLSTGGQVVTEGDLTASQLQDARHANGRMAVSSESVGVTLGAGTYTYAVTATTNGEEPSTRSTNIYVSTAAPLTSLVPSAAAMYPLDYNPGVAHEVTFRHGLDATVAEWSSPGFELVGDVGTLSIGYVDQTDPLLRWDGRAFLPGGSGLEYAPSGTYRARLKIRDDQQWIDGPLSQPFILSHGYRVSTERGTSRTANATRTTTLTKRYARLRAQDGSLYYCAVNRDWRNKPLVRTAHRVSIPRDRVAGTPAVLVVRGRWQWQRTSTSRS